jgi:3-dehydroquinate synthase
MEHEWQIDATFEKSYQIRAAGPFLRADNPSLVEIGDKPGRRFVLLDDGVPKLCEERLRRYFDAHGIESRIITVAGGEACKNLDTVASIVDELWRFGLDRRNEPIIIIGGGALLDTGGFAASMYRRGVPYIRVPTTLLAYVDASVGIKTGVNFDKSKNLVGSFYEPRLVILDNEFFHSLPDREIASGLGELLKLGLGCDGELFEMLEASADSIYSTRLCDQAGSEILARSITTMLTQLRPNLLESELCRAVDLGHTFSQAFEMSGGVGSVRHGEAVAMDLILSATISIRRDLFDEDDLDRLLKVTWRFGLPTMAPDVLPESVWESLVERTQHRGGRQRTPLPYRIGECVFVDDLTPKEIFGAMAAVRNEYDSVARI